MTRGYKKILWSSIVCLIFISSIAAAAYRDTSGSQSSSSDQYNQGGSQSQTGSQSETSDQWSDRSSDRMSTGTSGESNTWSERKGIHGRAGSLQSADKAIGMSVYNKQGDKIGSIKDLVVDKNHNAVSFVILSSGMKYYPVPWSAFSTGEKNYTLDVQKDGLRGAPTISSDDPAQLNSDTTQKAQSFFSRQISTSKELSSRMGSSMSQTGSSSGMTSSQAKYGTQGSSMSQTSSTSGMTASTQGTQGSSNYLSCKKVIGMEVKDNQDKKIGEIKDVIFDVRQGNIAYGLTSFGGVLGVAKKTAAVPWSAIQLQPDQKVARLNATEQTLTSAEINRDQLAKLNDPTFARQIHQSFGQEPYWEVYGYVPPSGEGARQGAAAGMRHGAGAAAGAAAGTFATGAWAADSEYNKSFKPDEVTTIEGTVKSVDTFTPETGANPGLKLKIETTNNETETVQLGPQSWMDQQGLKFNEGDKVTITGSRVRHGLSKVIMASEVKKADQTIRLRDEQGKPMWTSSTGSSSQGTVGMAGSSGAAGTAGSSSNTSGTTGTGSSDWSTSGTGGTMNDMNKPGTGAPGMQQTPGQTPGAGTTQTPGTTTPGTGTGTGTSGSSGTGTSGTEGTGTSGTSGSSY